MRGRPDAGWHLRNVLFVVGLPILLAGTLWRQVRCRRDGGHSYRPVSGTGSTALERCRDCPSIQVRERREVAENNRASIDLDDAILTFVVLVALMAMSPILASFVSMVTGTTSGLTQLLLQLVAPFLFLSLIVSMGVSATGGG
jgi:hypothetical protein